MGLRVGVVRVGSESRRTRSTRPADSAGVEEYSQSVVFEALKATTGALDLFDTEVLAFGGSIRRPGAVV